MGQQSPPDQDGGNAPAPTEREIQLQTRDAEGAMHTSTISEPGRLLRIAHMLRALQQEVHADGMDVPSRERLQQVHETATRQLGEILTGPISDELDAFTLPFGEDPPSESEMRLAQAQLVGWLEGLFQGIQAAIASQQQDAGRQLAQLRQQMSGQQGGGGGQTPGQYL